MPRRTYEQSFDELSEAANVVGEPRPAPTRPPRHDDEDPGPSLLRAQLADVDFFDLTLPGLFVTRSELRGVSFAGSNLSLSTMHWSDFVRCDFSGCDLSGCDLRGNTFEDCSFAGADLGTADLRYSSFTRCNVAGARLAGTRLTREQGGLLELTEAQAPVVDWHDDEDPGTGLPP